MHRALRIACLLLLTTAVLAPAHAAKQATAGVAVVSDSSPEPGRASLKISLRQRDDSPFSGIARIRLTAPTGSEVGGHRADSDDQTMFSNLAPGNYTVTAIAPGFTTVSETIDIKPRRELETIYLIMKPETFGTIRVDACSAVSIANSDADAFHWLPPSV